MRAGTTPFVRTCGVTRGEKRDPMFVGTISVLEHPIAE